MKRLSITFALFVLALYGGLIASIFYFLDANSIYDSLNSSRVFFAIKTSLLAATISTFLALLIAIPAGYAISRYNFRGKEIVNTLLEFPMVVSPAALGAIILIFFNNPVGIWIQDNIYNFVFSFGGIILAQFVTVLGVGVRFIKSAFDEVDKTLEDTAKSLGASGFYTFWHIVLPLAKRGIIAATILSWAKALGEFGATLTVAGTMAYKTETLPISIYMHLEMADIKTTLSLILILILFGLGALFVARQIFSRGLDAKS
jgi:molybdate transport system permease protein